MSSKAGKRLVLELRFPEFCSDGNWAAKTVTDLCIKITQGGTPDTSHPEYWNGDIEWLTPSEMGKSDTRFISSTVRKITHKGLENCSSEVLPKGSVIISTRAPIGHLAINRSPMAINQGCKGLIPARSTNASFLYYSLSISKRALIDLGAGNTFKELTGVSLKAFKVNVPQRHEEQKKIADCLSSLDDLITTQAKKIKVLKAHKKGLMQQLFPAEGETVPRLRFPKFRNAKGWSEKDVGSQLREVVRPVQMDNDQDYSLVTVKRRYGGVETRGVFKGGAIKVKSQFLIKENDFLISKRQIVHSACGVVPKRLEDFIVSNEYAVLEAKPDCDITFFWYFSQQPKVMASFLASSRGIVIEKMLFDLGYWLKLKFTFPSLAEQQKIGSLLASLDNLILAHSTRLEALKNHKKGLMQGLFPLSVEGDA
jgi:type I restriction enzyme S subunit